MTWEDVIAILKMVFDFFTMIFQFMWENEVMRVLIIIFIVVFIVRTIIDIRKRKKRYK